MRAPLLNDKRAEELANNLHAGWPEMTPAHAVGWFFALLPAGWKGATPQVKRIEL